MRVWSLLLVGWMLGCGGSTSSANEPETPSAPGASAAAAASATPEKTTEPASSAKPEASATPEAAARVAVASRYSVLGVPVNDVDAAVLSKKLGELGLTIEIPGTSGTMVAGRWETFNFGTRKGGKRHALVVIVRPARQPEAGADPAVEKAESPESKYELYRPTGGAVLDAEAHVMITVGLFKACAAVDPPKCTGGVIEADPAGAKKVFDSIFATKEPQAK